MIYQAYGRLIDTDIDLPGVQQAAGRPDLCLRLGRVRSYKTGWTNVWEPTRSAPWVRVRRSRTDYTIRYEQQVDFHYSPGARAITIHVHDCPQEAVSHFALDQVLPLVLSLDALVLHASAVVVDGTAVAFSGPGGSGKSTLALMLERAGHSVLCDDALLVTVENGRAAAAPAYPGLRFWPDISETAGRPSFDRGPYRKLRVFEGLRFHDGPLPLHHVVVIARDDSADPRFEPMSARDTAMALLGNAYRLEQHDARILAAEFDRALHISVGVRGWRFCYPHLHEAWSDVAAAVVAHVRSSVDPRSPVPQPLSPVPRPPFLCCS